MINCGACARLIVNYARDNNFCDIWKHCFHRISAVSVLWTSSVIYLVTPLLWLVKTPADMNELRDLHSSALILIASKIIMAMLAIRRGFSTLVLHLAQYP